MQTTTPKARFDGQLMAEDIALKGWLIGDVATKAKVSDMTVIRFLRGDTQTGKTAGKLARALGHPVRRYIVRASAARELAGVRS